MPDHGRHCPFLNRSQPGCSAYLTLERLRHAFEYCFDEYQTCPLYSELLVERRLRQNQRLAPSGVGSNHAASPLTPVAVLRRADKPLARSA